MMSSLNALRLKQCWLPWITKRTSASLCLWPGAINSAHLKGLLSERSDLHTHYKHIVHLLLPALPLQQGVVEVFFLLIGRHCCNLQQKLAEIAHHEFLAAWSPELVGVTIGKNKYLVAFLELNRMVLK